LVRGNQNGWAFGDCESGEGGGGRTGATGGGGACLAAPPPPRQSGENRTVSDVENEYIFIKETEDERRLSTSSPPKKC
jgi:hypothetical protein